MVARRNMYGLPFGVTFHKLSRMYEVHVWLPNVRAVTRGGRTALRCGMQVFVGAWRDRRTAEVAAPLARAALLGRPLPPDLAEAEAPLRAATEAAADRAIAVRGVRRVAALYASGDLATTQPASPSGATSDAARGAASGDPAELEATAAGALRLWDDHVAYLQAAS